MDFLYRILLCNTEKIQCYAVTKSFLNDAISLSSQKSFNVQVVSS